MVESDAKKRLLSLHALKEVGYCYSFCILSWTDCFVLLLRLSRIALTGNWRASQTCCGCHFLRTPKIQKKQRGMLLLPALGNWQPPILHGICRSCMCALCPLRNPPRTDKSLLCQARIHDKNAATRATVVSAIRYTFADTSQSYDELLAPLLVDFLSLMLDQDLVRYCLILPNKLIFIIFCLHRLSVV